MFEPVVRGGDHRIRAGRGWRCGVASLRRSAVSRLDWCARAGGLCGQPRGAISRVPVQVLRGARPQAPRGARRAGVDDAAGARPVRPRSVREFFAEWQRRGRGAITTANVASGDAVRRGRRSGSWRRCPKGIARSSARCCSARPRPPASASAPSRSRSRTACRSSSGCSSTSWKDTFTFADATARPARSRCGRRRIASTCSRTARCASSTTRLGRAPERKRSLQLPIYGVCAQQALDGRHGRSWTVSRAGYIAFKEKAAFCALQNRQLEKALADGAGALLRGGRRRSSAASSRCSPTSRSCCNWCAYAAVCRKDYVGDE